MIFFIASDKIDTETLRYSTGLLFLDNTWITNLFFPYYIEMDVGYIRNYILDPNRFNIKRRNVNISWMLLGSSKQLHYSTYTFKY